MEKWDSFRGKGRVNRGEKTIERIDRELFVARELFGYYYSIDRLDIDFVFF